MKRISTATKADDLFGAGKHGWRDGDLSISVIPTDGEAAWFNNLQEEIANVVEANGITLDGNVRTQLYQAIQLMIAGAINNGLKTPVRFTTIGNIVLSGLGTQAGGDWGVALTAGDRILPKDQATGSQNGIYIAAAGAWARATDADGVGELPPGALVAVQEGVTLDDSVWELSTDGPITIGTTALTFSRKDASIVVTASVQGAFKNLAGWADGISSFVGYSVDEIVSEANAGAYVTGRYLNLSINLATAGANGLDAGVVAANAWYSTWAMYNPTTLTWAGIAALCPVLTGTTSAGSAVVTGLPSTASMRVGMPLFGGSFPAGVVIKSVDSGTQITASRKATAAGAGVSLRFMYDPVIPLGYTCKVRVGAVPTDGTANKYPLGLTQFGRRVQIVVGASGNVLAMPLMGSGSAAQWTAIGVSPFVPPTASVIFGTTHNVGGLRTLLAPNANYGGAPSTTNGPMVDNNSASDLGFQFQMVLESANIYWYSSGSQVYCSGWEDNL